MQNSQLQLKCFLCVCCPRRTQLQVGRACSEHSQAPQPAHRCVGHGPGTAGSGLRLGARSGRGSGLFRHKREAVGVLRCPAVPRGARQSGWRVSVEKGPGADPDGVLGHAEEGLHPEVTGGHTHRWVSVLENLQREPGPWLGHVCWVCVLSDTLRVSEPAARARSVPHEMKVPSGSGSALGLGVSVKLQAGQSGRGGGFPCWKPAADKVSGQG